MIRRPGGGGGGSSSNNNNNNQSYSSGSSSSSTGFFSPREGRAVSLVNAFSPTPRAADGPASGISNQFASDYGGVHVAMTGGDAHVQPTAAVATSSSSAALNDTLPRLQDTSWIGANVSAIENDKEDDNNDDDENAAHDFENLLLGTQHHQQHQRQHHQGYYYNNTNNDTATERTKLLLEEAASDQDSYYNHQQHHHQQLLHRPMVQSRQQQTSFGKLMGFRRGGFGRRGGGGGDDIAAGYPIPLEESLGPLGSHPTGGGGSSSSSSSFSSAVRQCFLSKYMLRLLPTTSGLFLFCIAVHDIFLTYIHYRRRGASDGGSSSGNSDNYGQSETHPYYYPILLWTWPWGIPSETSLLRFGAYSTQRVVGYGEYWRCYTSMLWSVTSIAEWIVVVGIWWVIERTVETRIIVHERSLQRRYYLREMTAPFAYHPTFPQPTAATIATTGTTASTFTAPSTSSLDVAWWLWPITYIVSALTGQLWMIAFGNVTMTDDEWAANDYVNAGGMNADGTAANGITAEDGDPAVIGCVGWGTAGIACGMGMIWPSQRLKLFLLTIAIVLLSQFQPSSSSSTSSSSAAVFGSVGASFVGWTLCGTISFVWSTLCTMSRADPTGAGGGGYYYTENSFSHDGKDKTIGGNPNGWDVMGGIVSILGLITMWVVPAVYIWR